MTELSRRSLFAGVGALIAAPAIVRAASLMPVRAIVPVRRHTYLTLAEITSYEFRKANSFVRTIDLQWAELFTAPQRFMARPEWVETVYPIVHAAK